MRRTLKRSIPLVYFVLIIFGTLMVIKTGSSVFFYKQSVKKERISHQNGNAYLYSIDATPRFSSNEGLLLFEDDQQLERSLSTRVIELGGGNFSLKNLPDEKFILYFSATDNSDPRINNRHYRIYYPIEFFTRTRGIVFLTVLSLGLTWFLLYVYVSETRRQLLRTSPANIIHIFDTFTDQEVARVYSLIIGRQPFANSIRACWNNILFITVVAAYLYVFMEWLFFVTKPSFMDLTGWIEKLEILLVTGFFLALVSGILLLICFGLDILLTRIRIKALPLFISVLIPSIVFWVTALLLVDNFTYTVFKFGIVSTDGFWRGAYALVFIALFFYIYSRILGVTGFSQEANIQVETRQISVNLLVILLVVSAGIVIYQVWNGYSRNSRNAILQVDSGEIDRLPNILLLGNDGMNAANLSVYGYYRDTTPTLRKLAQDSLVAENAFTNAAHSSGSDISILTGRLPTQTRVLYPPDILKGADSYRHLPGILRKLGYYTVELGVDHYVDAYQMNLLDGFDSVNQMTYNENEVVLFAHQRWGSDSVYFISRLVERFSDRILHIFFIRKMENPYNIVTQPTKKSSDREKLELLLGLIRDTDRPLFVHAHMVFTHGPRFNPEVQVFSKGKTQEKDWMTAFYDDGILSFDYYIGEVLSTLEKTGKLDNTVLIIYTDHAKKYNVRVPIPLIFHFPGNEYASRIQNNVQNLDIAPTILDYLGLPLPTWMGGQSLLRGNPPQHRLIFSGATSADIVDTNEWILDLERVKPPFYQFSSFNIIDCDNWYYLDLTNLEWTTGEVPGHTSPCKESSKLSMDQAKVELAKHLSDSGFDVSTLP